MDKVGINGIKAYGRHGVLPEEAVLGQPFIVDIELKLNLEGAAQSDNLNLGVSYADVFDIVTHQITAKRYQLIEALCYHIIIDTLNLNEIIQSVKVIVKKPNAPLFGDFEYAKVEMKRGRDVLGLS